LAIAIGRNRDLSFSSASVARERVDIGLRREPAFARTQLSLSLFPVALFSLLRYSHPLRGGIPIQGAQEGGAQERESSASVYLNASEAVIA